MSPLFKDGFTAIRPGIKEHIEVGQFSAADLGIYLFLHLYAKWDSGVIWTTAASIKGTMKHKDIKLRTVQNCLNRLREKEYIDYPRGIGSGGVYPVLIVKATVTAGVLKGCRTIGFHDEQKQWVLYDVTDAENPTHVRTVCGLLYGPEMELVRSRWGAGAVVVHLQDIKTGRLSKYEEKQDNTHEVESAKPQKAGL
jgi:hypothetical protein